MSFKAEVEGDRVQVRNHSKDIHVVFYLEGPINEEKQPEQPFLFEKYCSVSKT
jgi:putative redox protein